MEIKPLVIGDLTAKIPIIQGGMGVGVSLSGLAAAVAKEGGIGVISTAQIGYNEEGFEENPMETNQHAILKQVAKAKELSDGGIIAANIMVATKDFEQYVRTAVKAGVDIIISGAGLPTSLPAFVEGAKTKIAPIVSSLKSASVICKLWDRRYKKVPDMVVIEGPKAGGHLGFTIEQLEHENELDFEEEIKKIIQLVKEYGKKYQKDIPVVVAGGIYEKKDMEEAFLLGADGVQVATRFVTTKECDVHENFKMAYINAKKEDIRLVKSPVGMPGRAISTPFLNKVETTKLEIKKCYQCLEHCDKDKIPYCITQALICAAKGDIEHALLFCGQNAYKATKIETVSEVIESFLY